MADERDPQVSRSYRELGAEEPPRAVDEAILAASRRAISDEMRSRPAPLVVPTGRRRWYFPVAAAAIITLAVAVTVQVERQKPDDELIVATAPPEARKEEPAVPEEKKQRAFKAPVEQAKPAPKPFAADPPAELAKSNQEARARSDAARDSVVAAPAPAPAPEPARREMESQRPQASTSAGARATGQLQSKVETPEAWLERIAALRKEGKHEEADKALAEFRKRYPDYRLTDEMRAKVEKK
jgi:hypothetical protein